MEYDYISSNRNNNVRYIQNLAIRKVRQEERCYFLEGLRAVDELLTAGKKIRKLVVSRSFVESEHYSRIMSRIDPEAVSILPVTDIIFKSISDTENPQGIGAVAEYEPVRRAVWNDNKALLGSASRTTSNNASQTSDNAIQTSASAIQTPASAIQTPASAIQTSANASQTSGSASKALPDSVSQALGRHVENVLVLEDVRDPGNMGTILRTADAAGFDGIIACKGCVDLYNSKVLRSAVGSIFHLTVLQCGSTFFCGEQSSAEEVLRWLKANHFTTYATSPASGKSCFNENFTGRTAVVIGNEANGLRKSIFDMCDVTLNIPMPGKAESLNASVAAALLMYEVARKKLIKGGAV